MKFHHLGFFCRNLGQGLSHFQQLLNITDVSDIYEDAKLGVKVQFLMVDDFLRYELVAPFGKNNPVDNVLNSRKNILNHIGFTTENFDEQILSLRKQKYMVIAGPKPAIAYDKKRVIFFLTPLGYIIEIIESISNT